MVTICHRPHQHQPMPSSNWTISHNTHNNHATTTSVMPPTTTMVHTMSATTTQASTVAQEISDKASRLPLQHQLPHNTSNNSSHSKFSHRMWPPTIRNNTIHKATNTPHSNHTDSSHQANCNWAGLPMVSATHSTKSKPHTTTNIKHNNLKPMNYYIRVLLAKKKLVSSFVSPQTSDNVCILTLHWKLYDFSFFYFLDLYFITKTIFLLWKTSRKCYIFFLQRRTTKTQLNLCKKLCIFVIIEWKRNEN